MGTIKDCWTWLDANDKPLKLLFALVAAGYVLFEYHSNQNDADVKRTLDLQARYSERDLLKAHLELDTFLLNPATKKAIDDAPVPGTKIMELVQANGYEKDVLVLADFFGQVTTCVREGLCDLATACAVFHDRIAAHRNNYFKLFEFWKSLWGQNFIEPSFDYFNKQCKS